MLLQYQIACCLFALVWLQKKSLKKEAVTKSGLGSSTRLFLVLFSLESWPQIQKVINEKKSAFFHGQVQSPCHCHDFDQSSIISRTALLSCVVP
jgi:hypothetical protein